MESVSETSHTWMMLCAKTLRFLVHDLRSFGATHQQLGSQTEMLSMSATEIEPFAVEDNLRSAFCDRDPSEVRIRHAS